MCFQFTHFLCDDWENIYIYIYTLSYYHHQIGSMNYYPLFRVRSWNNGMRCMAFYILIFIKIYARFGKIGFIQCSVDLGISIDISTWAYASRRWHIVIANPTSMIIRGKCPNIYELDELTTRRHLKSPWSLSVRSSRLTFRSHGHILGLEFNRYVCFSFRGNQTIYSWDIANSIFALENSRSMSWPRSKPMVPFEA